MSINRRQVLKGVAGAGGAAIAPSFLAVPALAQSLKGTGEVVVYDGGGSWGEAKRVALLKQADFEDLLVAFLFPEFLDQQVEACAGTF